MSAIRFSVISGLSLVAASASAQGNLSTQGFGYPAGQLSTRALGLAGSIGESDPQSVVNPAATALWGAPVLFVQYDPEFRTVKSANGTSHTTTARFPVAGFSLPIGSRYSLTASVSTFLDRTWATTSDQPQLIGTETVQVTQKFASDGAINDLRVAVAYAATPRFNIGIGAHAFTGENRITVQQLFPDSVRFSDLVESSNLSYGGVAFSAGLEWRPSRNWQLATSFRRGGDITAESGDTTVGRGRIPTRYGVGVSYAGVSGAVFSSRVAHESWSSLAGLGSATVTAFDGWDVGLGADATGPRVGRRVMMVRTGVRHRTLPFGAGGARVKELSFSGGFGLPLAYDRVFLDVSLVRAGRDAAHPPSGPGGGASGEVKETAYILSMGLRIRP